MSDKEEEKKHDVDYGDPEEDAKQKEGGLKDVEVKTGTEGEVCIYKQRIKLFRYRQNVTKDGMEWKERGIGNAKLLRNNDKK